MSRLRRALLATSAAGPVESRALHQDRHWLQGREPALIVRRVNRSLVPLRIVGAHRSGADARRWSPFLLVEHLKGSHNRRRRRKGRAAYASFGLIKQVGRGRGVDRARGEL